MSVLTGVVGAVASYYHDNTDIHSEEDRLITARRVIGKMARASIQDIPLCIRLAVRLPG